MLAESINVGSIDHYLSDDSWLAQQKLDGDRVLIHVTAEHGARALNRDGEPRRNGIPRGVLRQFDQMPGTWCLDGELVDGILWLFDLPRALDTIQPDTPFEQRIGVLERFFAGWGPDPEFVRLVPTARTTDEKRLLWDRVVASGAEGVMLRHRGLLYREGRRSRQMLKAKLTKTCDVVVTGVNVDGRLNCHYSLFDAGALREVGSCAMQGKPPVAPGDVIEVEYLYCGGDGRLYQPRMLRVRYDKAPTACTVDQLVYTDRTVLGLDVVDGVAPAKLTGPQQRALDVLAQRKAGAYLSPRWAPGRVNARAVRSLERLGLVEVMAGPDGRFARLKEAC